MLLSTILFFSIKQIKKNTVSLTKAHENFMYTHTIP